MAEALQRMRRFASGLTLLMVLATGLILLLSVLLGIGAFSYQRQLFDPAQFNRGLMLRAAEAIRVIERVPVRRREEAAELLSTGPVILLPRALDLSLVEIADVTRSERQLANMIARRIAEPPPLRRPGARGQRPGGQLRDLLPGAGDRRDGRGRDRPGGRGRDRERDAEFAPGLRTLPVDLSREREVAYVITRDRSGLREALEAMDVSGSDELSEVAQALPVLRRPIIAMTVKLRSRGSVSLIVVPVVRAPVFALLLIGGFVLTVLLTLSLALFIVLRVTRPVARLARGAETFGSSLTPVPVQGPRTGEIGTAITSFNSMQQQIRAAIDQRGQLIAAVNHDLRTYLTRLRLRLDFMKESGAPADLVERSEQDLDDMLAMLNQNLDYAKTSVETLRTGPLDLIALLEAFAAERGMPFTARVPSVAVEGDPGALRRLFSNLAENSQRYADTPEIRVSGPESGFLKVQFLDKGPGIAPENRARALEPFARLETSRNRATGGTGLGLAIVADIARQHGAELLLQDRPDGGQGLCVSLRFPVTV